MPSLLSGHGNVSNRAFFEEVFHQSPLVKCTFSARVSFDQSSQYERARVSHLGHPLIRAAQTSNDPHLPSSPAPQIPEDDKLNGNKSNAKTASKESIMTKLRRYGVAGMLSYGLLNTVYYLGMFLFAWFYISPAPSGLGYRAAAERFIKLFALVWAGSQVTKLLRAGCGLALAPAIDRGLTWLTDHSRFKSRAEVFGVIVFSCFSLALAVFLAITFLWA